MQPRYNTSPRQQPLWPKIGESPEVYPKEQDVSPKRATIVQDYRVCRATNTKVSYTPVSRLPLFICSAMESV